MTVVVVGGGPAGAVTAGLLSRAKISTLVVERGRFDERPDVDVLSPEVQMELRRLGLWERFTAGAPLPCHAIESAWGRRQVREQHFIRNPYGAGWCVSRGWLDGFLAQQARDAGAGVLTQARVTQLARTGSQWRVGIEAAAGHRTVLCDFLVDASGPGASVARMLGVERMTVDRLVGLSRRFPARRLAPSADPVLLLETHPLGWWYSMHAETGVLVVTLVTGRGFPGGTTSARERVWNRALDDTPETRRRSEGCGTPDALRARPAPVGRLERAAGDGWLAVGDAASAFDPLSGSGVRKALHEAERAATAIRHALQGSPDALSTYATRLAEAFRRHLDTRREYYGRERRWAGAPFWAERARPA